MTESERWFAEHTGKQMGLLRIELVDQKKQIALMSTTQERQRNMIQGFQKSQSEFIDELVAQDNKIAHLEAKLDIAENVMHNVGIQTLNLYNEQVEVIER